MSAHPRSALSKFIGLLLTGALLIGCGAALLSISESSAPPASSNKTAIQADSSFLVNFLDVGQGDATLVECDNHYLLIDGGPPEASSLLYSYLSKRGINKLDYLVSTHPDTDHTGGLPGALQVAKVGRAFSPVTHAPEKSFNAMLKYLGKQGIELEVPKAGQEFDLGSAKVQVIAPVYRADNDNDNSIMLRIVYGQTSFLFTGDASRESERAVVEAGYTLASDVLKVGHHGSASSTSYPFLREVMPRFAVISVGKDNPYGHPTKRVLSRLADAGAKVYRTDLSGHINVKSNGKTISISTEKSASSTTFSLVAH